MNKIDEYKSKIRWDVWEDVTSIKQPRDETEKINAIRNAILDKCLYDGGEQVRQAGNRNLELHGWSRHRPKS